MEDHTVRLRERLTRNQVSRFRQVPIKTPAILRNQKKAQAALTKVLGQESSNNEQACENTIFDSSLLVSLFCQVIQKYRVYLTDIFSCCSKDFCSQHIELGTIP